MHDLAGIGLPCAVFVPPRPHPAAPLLVFFHGAGAGAGQSLRLVQEPAADAGVAVLAPNSAGRTWDLLSRGLGPDLTALDAALEHVLGVHPVGRVGFGGFSDGASYALSLGLANGDLADTVLAFSPGFVAAPARVGRPRVWLSHGVADTVLPVDGCGRRVARELAAAGYTVAYEEFDGGHVVPAQLVSGALQWWLQS